MVVVVCTSGNAASDLFFPATPALRTAAWSDGLITLDVLVSTNVSNIEVQRSYVTSQDGISWSAPTAMADSAWVSALGPDYGGNTTTVLLTKPYWRFGVTTNQKAGSAIEQMRVSVQLTLVKR